MVSRKNKIEACPNIDLGGRVAVMDTTGPVPVWRVLARVFATRANARRVAREHGLVAVWLLDDLGGKQYVRV